jgi:predicted nucleic acid-binding protein
MAAFIFDASGIVKRYLTEIGTAWVQGLTDPADAHEIFLTRLTRVEIVAAITRRSRGGRLPAAAAPALLAQFRHDAAHQYTILEITPAVLADAERLAEIHGLRAYDAVQLAAAAADLHRERLANGLSRPTLISADQELNVAAMSERIHVDDPTAHP